MPFSPLIISTFLIAFFCLFIFFGKYLVNSMPICSLVFFYLVLEAVFEAIKIIKKKNFSMSINLTGIQFILSFAYLGFWFCFLGSLSNLPLILAVAIYLSYPLIVPWIFKVWMGKRVGKWVAFGSFLIVLAILSSFEVKLKLQNVLIAVAIFSALLKALCQSGYDRMAISEPPLSIWVIQYGCSITAAALLLIGNWAMPSYKTLGALLVFCILKYSYKWAYDQLKQSLNLLKATNLLNLSLLVCGILDWVIFKSIMTWHLLLSATLIYFGIFFTLLEKNILSNSFHDI